MLGTVYKRFCGVAGVQPLPWDEQQCCEPVDPEPSFTLALGLFFLCKAEEAKMQAMAAKAERAVIEIKLNHLQTHGFNWRQIEQPCRITLQTLYIHFGQQFPITTTPEQAIEEFATGKTKDARQLALHIECLFKLPYINKAAIINALNVAVSDAWKNWVATMCADELEQLAAEALAVKQQEECLQAKVLAHCTRANNCIGKLLCTDCSETDPRFARNMKNRAGFLFVNEGTAPLFPSPARVSKVGFLSAISQTGVSNITFG